MAYVPDVMLIAQVTGSRRKGEPPSVQPLLKYLRSDRPFTDLMRKWFIELLDVKGQGRFRLTLSPRRGRHVSHEDVTLHVEAYRYVNELAEKNISSRVCRLILQDLKGRTLRIERQGTKTTFFIERHGETEFRLVKGRKFPSGLAIKIASAKFNRSPGSIKKSIAAIDKSKREF